MLSHSLKIHETYNTRLATPICPQPVDGPADEKRHLDSALLLATQLSSGPVFLSPPSTHQVNGWAREPGNRTQTNRHFLQLITHRPDPSRISSNPPTPVLTKITVYYQILPCPPPPNPSLIPFRPYKRPGSRVTQIHTPSLNPPRPRPPAQSRNPRAQSVSQPSLGFPSGWGRMWVSGRWRNELTNEGVHAPPPPSGRQPPPPPPLPSQGRPWMGISPDPAGRRKRRRQKEKSGRHNLYLLARIQSPRNVRTLLRSIISPRAGPPAGLPPFSPPRLNKKKQGPKREGGSADHNARARQTGLTCDPWPVGPQGNGREGEQGRKTKSCTEHPG